MQSQAIKSLLKRNRRKFEENHARFLVECRRLREFRYSSDLRIPSFDKQSKTGYMTRRNVLKHIYVSIKRREIEYNPATGRYRVIPIIERISSPEGFMTDISDLSMILEPKVVSDYFYPNENERGVGGVFVLASTGSFQSGIINRASLSDFLYSDPYWLKEVFAYGLRQRMIDEKFFRSFDTLSTNELDRYVLKLWEQLFGDCICFATVFWFNPQKLLRRIILSPEDENRENLKKLLNEDFRNSILKEAYKIPKEYTVRVREDRYSKK